MAGYNKEYMKKYSRTRSGLFGIMYKAQKRRSKDRKYPPPNYTLKELRCKFINTNKFKVLFLGWVVSGYDKESIPSFDRIDCNKPYTLDNIQLMTWIQNKEKGYVERSKVVIKYSMSCTFIREFPSVVVASKETGIGRSGISRACTGIRDSAGGFKWRYKIK